MQAIQECIRTVVAQPGWDLGRLAEELGIHRASLRRLRDGQVEEPKFEVVGRLMKLAGRSVDDLLGIETDQTRPLLTEDRRLLVELRQRAERAEWMLDQLRGGQPAVAEEEEEYDLDLEAAEQIKLGMDVARARHDLRDGMAETADEIQKDQDSQADTTERTG